MGNRNSSPYWKSAGFKIESCEVCSEGLAEKVRTVPESCSRTVHVCCVDHRVPGSVRVKVKTSWQYGCEGIVKNASLRSNREN